MISILILTHNRLEAVQRCFDSLEGTLNDPNVECHILDNASSDGTADFVEQLPEMMRGANVKVTLSEENLGVAGGRAKLIELAKGDPIVFLDSDVVIHSADWPHSLLVALDPENVGIAGVAGSYIAWDYNLLFTAAPIGQVDVVCGFCFAVKREVLDAGVQIRVDDFPGFWHEDSAMCLDCYEAGWDVVSVGYNIGVEHTPGSSGDAAGLQVQATARFRELYEDKGLTHREGAF